MKWVCIRLMNSTGWTVRKQASEAAVSLPAVSDLRRMALKTVSAVQVLSSLTASDVDIFECKKD